MHCKKEGCIDKNAINYDSTANTSNGSCKYKKTITETELIKYTIKYQDNDEMLLDEERIAVKGVEGKKQVTYDAVVDKDGNVITKEKVSETVVLEPVDEIVEVGTKTESDSGFMIVWLVSLVISFYYALKNKNGNLILNKIGKKNMTLKIILYPLYLMFIIPSFIDTILAIINMIKGKKILKEN